MAHHIIINEMTLIKTNKIIDQAVPEINVPVLKPIKVENTANQSTIKTVVDNTQKKINEFADWIMSYITQEIKKPVNARVEEWKKTVNDIYNKLKKPVIQKKKTAMKGFLTSYRIKGEAKMDPKVFLHNNKNSVVGMVNKQKKPIKMKMLLECVFYKKKPNKEVEYTFGYFHSNIVIVTQATEMNDVYKMLTENILEKISNFLNSGSGWIFSRVENFDIHIDKYQPIAAKSWIELTQKLKLKKAIVNPENEDNKCFKWADTTGIYPAKRDLERISKALKLNSEKLREGVSKSRPGVCKMKK